MRPNSARANGPVVLPFLAKCQTFSTGGGGGVRVPIGVGGATVVPLMVRPRPTPDAHPGTRRALFFGTFRPNKGIEVLLERRHPVYIITKSALVERDLDLLGAMAEQSLVSVSFSITTLYPELARRMEPRAAAPRRRARRGAA